MSLARVFREITLICAKYSLKVDQLGVGYPQALQVRSAPIRGNGEASGLGARREAPNLDLTGTSEGRGLDRRTELEG